MTTTMDQASTTASEIAHPWKPVKAARPLSTNPLSGIKPKRYLVHGVPKEFYAIGALAHVLNRKSDTLRGWEDKGWLPKPTAVFSGRDPRDAVSSRHGRRRLYTREQILGLYQLAIEEGILEPHATPISDTRFPARAAQLFTDLIAKERGSAA